MKKFIAILMSVCLTALVISGCGNNTNNPTEAPTEDTTAAQEIEYDYKNPYTQAIIENKIDEVVRLQESGNSTFITVTDIHIDTTDDEELDRLRDVVLMTHYMNIDYVVMLGDFINEYYTHDEAMDLLRTVKEVLDECDCPVYYTRGDHDFNAIDETYGVGDEAADIITGEDFASIFEQNDNENIVRDSNNPDGNYYYVDMPQLKQRAVFVNTYEFVAGTNGGLNVDDEGNLDYWLSKVKSNEQISWLINSALDMTGKSDWDVIFFSHNVPYAGEAFHNYGAENEPLRQIIKAFKNGESWSGEYNSRDGNENITADFTEQGPILVIGWFSGHIHDDCYDYVDGLNMYSSVNAAAKQRTKWSTDETPTKLPPTRDTEETKMSINLFVVNSVDNAVDRVKFGATSEDAPSPTFFYS